MEHRERPRHPRRDRCRTRYRGMCASTDRSYPADSPGTGGRRHIGPDSRTRDSRASSRRRKMSRPLERAPTTPVGLFSSLLVSRVRDEPTKRRAWWGPSPRDTLCRGASPHSNGPRDRWWSASAIRRSHGPAGRAPTPPGAVSQRTFDSGHEQDAKTRRLLKKVQLRGGARGPRARRTPCTLSVRPRAPTKQMGLFQQSA